MVNTKKKKISGKQYYIRYQYWNKNSNLRTGPVLGIGSSGRGEGTEKGCGRMNMV
jgi:hypothetical protein